MSQQTKQRIISTWCDEKDCDFHAAPSNIRNADQHQAYTNKIRGFGWTMRRKKSSEKEVVNGWRHRCPNCSMIKGALK